MVVESPEGVQYERNTTHVKSFHERKSGPEEVELPAQVPEIHPEKKGSHRAEEESPAAEKTLTHHHEQMPNRDSNPPRKESVPEVPEIGASQVPEIGAYQTFAEEIGRLRYELSIFELSI